MPFLLSRASGWLSQSGNSTPVLGVLFLDPIHKTRLLLALRIIEARIFLKRVLALSKVAFCGWGPNLTPLARHGGGVRQFELSLYHYLYSTSKNFTWPELPLSSSPGHDNYSSSRCCKRKIIKKN
jgi:hypothetical protein